eukprot:5695821-Prorocentrum_lima.AAC.1
MHGVAVALVLQGHILLPILPCPLDSCSTIQSASFWLMKQYVSTIVGLVLPMWRSLRPSL